METSTSDDDHSGSGLTFTFDITELVEALAEAGAWDDHDVRVTIVPELEEGDDEVDDDTVSVGRVGIYVG